MIGPCTRRHGSPIMHWKRPFQAPFITCWLSPSSLRYIFPHHIKDVPSANTPPPLQGPTHVRKHHSGLWYYKQSAMEITDSNTIHRRNSIFENRLSISKWNKWEENKLIKRHNHKISTSSMTTLQRYSKLFWAVVFEIVCFGAMDLVHPKTI